MVPLERMFPARLWRCVCPPSPRMCGHARRGAGRSTGRSCPLRYTPCGVCRACFCPRPLAWHVFVQSVHYGCATPPSVSCMGKWAEKEKDGLRCQAESVSVNARKGWARITPCPGAAPSSCRPSRAQECPGRRWRPRLSCTGSRSPEWG